MIVLFVIVAVLLTLIILLQSSKASGMGLFGSSSADSVLGAGGIDTLQKITAVLAIIFVALAFGISFMYSKSKTDVDKELDKLMNQPQVQQQEPSQQAEPSALPGLDSTTVPSSPDTAK
jgi:protein translocase SecG subunit